MVLNSIVFELALMCWERGSLWDESSVECPQTFDFRGAVDPRCRWQSRKSYISIFFLQVKLGSGWEE